MSGSFEFDLPATMGGPTIITFTDDKFTFQNAEGRKHLASGTFACDTAKSPNQITFNFSNRTVVGIYSLSDARLRICVADDDKVPPRDFIGGPGEKPALLIFVRR